MKLIFILGIVLSAAAKGCVRTAAVAAKASADADKTEEQQSNSEASSSTELSGNDMPEAPYEEASSEENSNNTESPVGTEPEYPSRTLDDITVEEAESIGLF
jgi:hypothetical protein